MNFTDFSKKNIIVIDQVFSEDELSLIHKDILRVKTESLFKDSKIGKTTQDNKKIRSDQIYWLDESNLETQAQKICLEKLERIKDELNKELFLGINNLEAHYAFYGQNTFYKRHLDSFKLDNNRIVSFILYLNPNWKPEHKGELKVYSSWDLIEPEITIEPIWGRVVLFLSDEVIHEVALTTQPRLSLTAWFRADPFKNQL